MYCMYPATAAIFLVVSRSSTFPNISASLVRRLYTSESDQASCAFVRICTSLVNVKTSDFRSYHPAFEESMLSSFHAWVPVPNTATDVPALKSNALVFTKMESVYMFTFERNEKFLIFES